MSENNKIIQGLAMLIDLHREQSKWIDSIEKLGVQINDKMCCNHEDIDAIALIIGLPNEGDIIENNNGCIHEFCKDGWCDDIYDGEKDSVDIIKDMIDFLHRAKHRPDLQWYSLDGRECSCCYCNIAVIEIEEDIKDYKYLCAECYNELYKTGCNCYSLLENNKE